MTDILQEASELINGQRAQDYGGVTDNFERIADLWTTYVGDVVPFTAFDVSNMMILVKVARIRSGSNGVGTGFHRDSYVDIAGYAALAEKVNDEIGLSQEEPTNNVTDWDEFWSDIDVSIAEAGNYPLVPRPTRSWDFLNLVPHGVQVTDKWGDVWTHKLGTWGFDVEADGDWLRADFPPERYDHQCAPFTEILDAK